MVDGARSTQGRGIPVAEATKLVAGTMRGTAELLHAREVDTFGLRREVTSPGGTTIAAIRHLEEAGVRAAFLNAIDAARQRSLELAQGGDDDED